MKTGGADARSAALWHHPHQHHSVRKNLGKDAGETPKGLVRNRTPIKCLAGEGTGHPNPGFLKPLFLYSMCDYKKKAIHMFFLSYRRLFTVATTIFHTLKTYSNFIFPISRRQPFKHSTKKLKKVKGNVVTKPVNKIFKVALNLPTTHLFRLQKASRKSLRLLLIKQFQQPSTIVIISPIDLTFTIF